MDVPLRLPDGYVSRRVGESELPLVLEVERAAYESPWSAPVFAAELGNGCSTMTMVAEATAPDKAVAHLVYWIVHDELHLLNVAVHPAYQRRGLASALMDHLFELCRSHRLIYIVLEVRRSNVGAQRLYSSYQFKEIGVRKAYYPDNKEDAIVMAVVLDNDGQVVPT